jgi:hypothetical protein
MRRPMDRQGRVLGELLPDVPAGRHAAARRTRHCGPTFRAVMPSGHVMVSPSATRALRPIVRRSVRTSMSSTFAACASLIHSPGAAGSPLIGAVVVVFFLVMECSCLA